MHEPGRLEVRHTALAVIDMQEAFRAVIPDFATVAERIGRAVQGARLLGVPILVTEQYPRGLKHTAPELADHLDGVAALEKTCFSSWDAAGFADGLRARDVRAVMVCGIEAHICVTQTVLDLLDNGLQVHLLLDCITARDRANQKIARQRMVQAGAVPSCLEMALFELMRSSDSPQFKAVQNLIR